MKKIVVGSIVLVIFLFAAAEKSLACSCVVSAEPAKKQVQQAFTDYDAIFSGAVVEIKESPADKYTLIVKFKVAQSWKGDLEGEIIVSTARDSAACGYNFEVGKKYLVYASGSKGNFSANNCSRTTIADGKGDVKFLKKLKRARKVAA